ncbi:MAG: glycosyltransferase family 4 protein [Bacteroidales bacterium]|nr:glycosyltransferase family 4 protein [Bacteroidales bacterium]
MKVSVISASFFESTFPLIKHVSTHTPVDLFCVIQKTFLNPAMMDISFQAKNIKCGILTPEQSSIVIPEHVHYYFEKSDVTIQIVVFSGGKRFFKDIITSFHLSRLIKKRKYSICHIIGTYVLFPIIECLLPKDKIVHTLHESCDRILMLDKNRIKHLFFKILFRIFEKRPIRLIFHSKSVRSEYHNSFSKPLNQTTVIPFGLFEGYKTFKESDDLKLPGKDYFLFVGYIHPYKGVDLLVKVAQSISDQNIDCKFIIAGKDATNLNDRFKIPKNLILINKYLSETEIVTLIKNCYAIILPYTSSSQSGIPNTGFCFNKPIIASDLEGIKDIVYHNINGLLFKNGDLKELEENIIKLWKSNELYQKMVRNIEEQVNLKWMDWKKLALNTFNWYNIQEI